MTNRHRLWVEHRGASRWREANSSKRLIRRTNYVRFPKNRFEDPSIVMAL